jgi:hypothetical protein
MKPEEILPFAIQITHLNNKTILEMNNGTKIIGYFDLDDSDSIKTNIWRFVKTPINQDDKYSLINGIEISSITIIELTN